MINSKKRFINALTSLMLTLALILSGISADAQPAYAEDGSSAAAISEIWVVPEVISGARQPASGGLFAWVTFDYSYYGNQLADDLNADDFTLQMKTQGSDWEDVSGKNMAMMGGEEYYIASFEAIIAARVPENKDPFIKKWRVVYRPEGAEQGIESEIIVQAAALEETDDVKAFCKEYCADFTVEQVPWSYEEYQQDHIPPVFVAYVYPDVTTTYSDPGLARTEGTSHRIVLPNIGSWDYENGQGFGREDLQTVETDIRLGDTGEDNGGIAGLVDTWKAYRDGNMEYGYFDEWPGMQEIPEAEDLYNKLASTVCVTDENADEYLSYVIDGTNVFWVSGASTQEAADNGVTDHILVVVRDLESYGTSKHDWSSEPEWTWAGSDESGYTAAIATFKCANHEGHVSRAAAVVRSTDDGETITYTAKAVFNGKTYKDTKKVEIKEEPEEPLPVPSAAEQASKSAATAAATVSVNSSTVNASVIKNAIQAAGGSADTLVIGKKVKKISKGALKGTGVKTLIVKSKKLKKKTVKGSLKKSSVKTVKVQIGSKKVNRKYVKKYKKIFTKKNAGRKVKVK